MNPISTPVNPESEEWAKMDMDEQLEKCYIEEKVAKDMDTMALAQTVLSYPFLDDIFLFPKPMEDRKNGKNTWRTGIETIGERWPALRVLLERKDAEKVFSELEKDATEDEKKMMEIFRAYIDADWGERTTAPN